MESKRHQKLHEHYKTILKDEPVFSLKLKKNVLPTGMKPITTLAFKPFKPTEETEDMPFGKLCTIGASDYLMPERNIGWGRKANRRNEYMMLIYPEVEVDESKTEWLFLNSLLWSTAEYSFNEKEAITVSDTIDMGIKGKYCGTVLLLPEAFKTPKIVKCHYTKHKYISVFQVMPVTRKLLSKKLKTMESIGSWSISIRTTMTTSSCHLSRMPRCEAVA